MVSWERLLRTLGTLVVAGAWASGCGGTSTRTSGDPSAGRGGGGGSSAAPSSGGAPGASGASARAGQGGSSPGGAGSANVGGAFTAGTGGSGAGSAGCPGDISCNGPDCPDGNFVPGEPCQCYVCSCEGIECPALDCAEGQVPVLGRWHCCHQCSQPNIDACQTASDCVLAVSTYECCGCLKAVSNVHVHVDECLREQTAEPDPLPQCTLPCPKIACGTCPDVAGVACIEGICVETYRGGGPL